MRLEALKRIRWNAGQTRVRVEKVSVKAPLRPPGHLERARTGREERAGGPGFAQRARLDSAPCHNGVTPFTAGIAVV